MANPGIVTAATKILAAWGNDVVSRVLGVYASTAAAEADGRTEDGQMIVAFGNDPLVRVFGGWRRMHPTTLFDANTSFYYAHQSTAAEEAYPGIPTGEGIGTDDHYGEPVNVYVGAHLQAQANATLTRVSLRIDLSRNQGSTWNLGEWFDGDVANGQRRPAFAHHHLRNTTIISDLTWRLMTKVDVLGSPGDVELYAPLFLTAIVAPQLAGVSS